MVGITDLVSQQMCIGQMWCWQCRGGMLNQQRSPEPSFHKALGYSEIEFVLFPWRYGIRFCLNYFLFWAWEIRTGVLLGASRSAGFPLFSPSLCSMHIFHQRLACQHTFIQRESMFISWRITMCDVWGSHLPSMKMCGTSRRLLVWALPTNEREVTSSALRTCIHV
jgi:hypothetical protein